MTDSKPLPPTASAEGETAVLQAQAIDIDTFDKHQMPKDTNETINTAAKSKKDADAGFKNYIVRRIASVHVKCADAVTACVQIWDGT
jgi:hypothetical protein